MKDIAKSKVNYLLGMSTKILSEVLSFVNQVPTMYFSDYAIHEHLD